MPIEVESPEELGYATIRHNLAESSIADQRLADLGISLAPDQLLLQYGDHRGHPGLRALLAAESESTENQVLLTPGAAGALFIVHTTLLDSSSHAVVIRPNYATNVETPRAAEAEISYLDLEFDRGWRYTALKIAALLRANTRLISIATPHNPTGTALPSDELDRIIELAESRGIWLLVDETYRDLSVATPPLFAASRSARVISVGSLSKAYGIPGLRLGWLVCRDDTLGKTLLAAKEQMVIAGPILEEEIGFQVYRSRAVRRPAIAALVADRIAVVRRWIEGQDAVEWIEPAGGVVCFPRIKSTVTLDVDRFYRVLLDDFGTYVGPGHWFEQSRRYFRLGFGWPSQESLSEGMAAISAAIERARTG